MSDDLSSFEAELRGFRARPLPPALRSRIANRLVESAPVSGSLRQRLALAGGLIAAGLALVVVLNVLGPPRRGGPTVSEHVSKRAAPLPSVGAYRQALSRSPGALEALLDQQAVYTAEPASKVQSTTAFTPGGRDFLIWRGDR